MLVTRTCRMGLLLVGVILSTGAPAFPESSASAAPAEGGPFAGEWRNPVSWTQGIVRIEIEQQGDRFTVHAWGRCHPTPCDWGELPAQAFVAHTTGKPVALRMVYTDPEQETRLYLRIEERTGQLRAETYTVFTDSRPAYWAAYFLNRTVPQSPTP